MYTNGDDQLNALLGVSITSLDITTDEYLLAVSRYEDAGHFLAEYWGESSTGGVIHPQGSMRLGTVTRNIHRNDEIDIDLVALRHLTKASTSKRELKSDVGHGLDLFVKTGPEGDPSNEEGKRCWTLRYPGFHLDVLPALPDENDDGTGIIITDTAVQTWLESNPIGFANWFHVVMREEWTEKRAALSKAIEVDDVPDWAVKTTLQQTVQALKRHRDLYFTHRLDERPASVIITTLAAQAYRGGGSLYDVLVAAAANMPGLVESHNGVYVVSNPVQPKENFADRWRDDRTKAESFFEWIDKAHADFRDLGSQRGVNAVLEKVAKSLGDRAADAAQRADGSTLLTGRRSGALAMASGTGTLSQSGTRRVPAHDFHGDAPSDA